MLDNLLCSTMIQLVVLFPELDSFCLTGMRQQDYCVCVNVNFWRHTCTQFVQGPVMPSDQSRNISSGILRGNAGPIDESLFFMSGTIGDASCSLLTGLGPSCVPAAVQT